MLRSSNHPVRRGALASLVTLALIGAAAAPGTSALGAPSRPGAPAAAQPQATLVGELGAAGGGGTRLDTEPATGAISFVGFPAGTSWRPAATATTDPATVAGDFVERYASLFGARAADLRARRPVPTPQGGSLIRWTQRYRSVPVAGAELAVQLDNAGGVITATGRLVPTPDLLTAPRISASRARAAATAAAARNWRAEAAQISAGTPVTTVYDPALQGRAATTRPVLAWRVPVEGTSAGTPHSGAVFIDARSGNSLATVEDVHTALTRLVCDNQNAAALPATCGESRAVRLEGGTGPINGQAEAAYTYLGNLYSFLRTRFNRDGVDGSGRPMKAVVRYCGPGSCPYANAYWDGEDTTVFGDGFVADDVVFHELAHGLTQHTSRLVYLGESGAINESISDAFGEFIDLLTPGDGSDDGAFPWLLGEDLDILGGAERSMANPGASRVPQPDSLLSARFLRFPLSTSCGVDNDFCGVHRNSGVGNKAAFLIAAGGTFNGQVITGLGVEKAAAIYFQVENLLGPTGRYRDLANALRQGCANLVGTTPVGATPVGTADCTQVERAVQATQMEATGAANRPPRAPDRSVGVRKNGAVRLNLLAGTSDPDGDRVSFGTATNGLRGRVACTSSGTCIYAPGRGITGRDAFTYTVRDGRGAVASATVRVAISGAFAAKVTSAKARAKAQAEARKATRKNAHSFAPALGSGAGRDEVTLTRTGGITYGIRGVCRSGDIEVARRDGAIRSITGQGNLSRTLSVVFDLTVRKGKAFGVIRVRESAQGIADKIVVRGVRIAESGEQVGATVRWHTGGRTRTLTWLVRDLHR